MLGEIDDKPDDEVISDEDRALADTFAAQMGEVLELLRSAKTYGDLKKIEALVDTFEPGEDPPA